MKSVAIVGSGIAGMACAYFLRKQFDVHVFEKNSYIGGHTNTVSLTEEGVDVHIDTGFMVYNEVTYPNLTRLFQVLKVETFATSMSFSVQHCPSGLEFAGTGLNGLFAQRRRLLSLAHYRLLLEINRFNNTCEEVLDNPEYQQMTLAEYLDHKGFSNAFKDHYLIPMSSAVWSTPPDLMLGFPALTLIRFFKNHGFLGLHCQHQWRTVKGGARVYRDKIVNSLQNRFYSSKEVNHIKRIKDGCVVSLKNGENLEFDYVIAATHADESLALLANPTPLQENLLSKFKYQSNVATLHTDDAVMPKNRRAWCSWNYRIDEEGGRLLPTTIYWMNSLQRVSDRTNYFVSIDTKDDVMGNASAAPIDPQKTIRRINYTHPVFSLEAIKAQDDLYKLNERGPIFFCGSYFKYGFHEDALTSAINASSRLMGESVWA